MAKELEKVGSYEVATIDQNALREIFDENQGTDEVIGAGDLPRITLPSGTSSVWELPSIQGPQPAASFEGILVSWKRNRGYWPNKYSGQGESPDCKSLDGITGIGDPGGLCEDCPLSKWNNETSEPPACTNQRVLFIVRENNILPLVLVLPPTSIPAMRKLMLNLTNEKLPYWAVVISFALEKDKSSGGITFSKLNPSVVRVLDSEEQKRVKGYVYLIKNLVQKTHAGPEDNNDTKDVEDMEPIVDIPEDIEIEPEDFGEEGPTDEPEINNSLTKEPPAKKGNGGDKEDDEFKVMDDFLKKETPDWTYFWVSCKMLGFDKAQVHKILKTESIKDIPKDRLNVFLRSEYAKKLGEPRL